MDRDVYVMCDVCLMYEAVATPYWRIENHVVNWVSLNSCCVCSGG